MHVQNNTFLLYIYIDSNPYTFLNYPKISDC